MKKDFKNNLMKKIKKEKIKPISKKYYIFRKVFVYLFLGISIFIGAVSVAIIFGYLYEADWILNHRIGLLKITLTFLPFFWIIFLVISSLLVYFNFKKNTQKGYKFYCWQIVLANILISFILGLIFYFSGFSQNIENKLQNNMHHYRDYLVGDKLSRMKQVWQNEDAGLLLGQILSTEGFNPLNSFKLKDTNQKIWKINLSKNIIIRHNLELKYGLKIKLMGKKIGKNIFEVEEIRPFMGNGKGFMKNHNTFLTK